MSLCLLGTGLHWKNVYVGLDLTKKDREEARIKEERMKEEAKKKTEEELKLKKREKKGK